MNFKERYIQTTNYSRGQYITPSGIVLHHIDYDEEDVIKMFTNREGQLSTGDIFNDPVSAHVYIKKDGDRIKFGEDNQKLWHAGKSVFRGVKGCNNFMLGVEFEGNTNKHPLTYRQICSFIEWLIPRLERWPIGYNDITTHMRVSPGRKTDISEKEFEKIQAAIKYLFV